MNWYTEAQSEDRTFDDRNRINRNIRTLEIISKKLFYAAKLVHQTQRGARKLVDEITREDILSSYPILTEALLVADNFALDSPIKFAEACYAGMDEIVIRIGKLKSERNKKEDPNAWKKGLD